MKQEATAAQRWADELAGWRIDPQILASAPESPYGFPPQLFRAHHHAALPSPLTGRAAEALPFGGSVLDVGAGAGAASLPLAERPGRLARLVAVDNQPTMLDALEAAAAEVPDGPLPVTRVDGTWPEVAGTVPVCDVVVCSHVFYNVPDLPAFAAALTAHAGRRVVVELHAEHPWVPLGPLWEHFHGQPRPTGPTATLAVEVLREAGIEAQEQRYERPAPHLDADDRALDVAFTRRRLCIGPDRDAEVEALLARHRPASRESVVLWWDR